MLTKDRHTKQHNGVLRSDPLAAAAVIFAGAMYALNAAGNAVPAGTAGSGPARGVARVRADNSAGIAGAVRVDGTGGCFQFANSGGGDAIGRGAIGSDCYIVDDATVALTDDDGDREVAGRIFDVDAGGVWVEIR